VSSLDVLAGYDREVNRRRALLVVVCAAGAAVLVAAGRVERTSAASSQMNGMKHVLALVGPRWATTASAYRLAPVFDCLLYRVGPDPYALELCFDESGRIIQAFDRRGNGSKLWSLRYDPSESTLREDPKTVLRAFVAVGAAPKGASSIPLGQFDHGPVLASPAR
jgi:hypothetical protein